MFKTQPQEKTKNVWKKKIFKNFHCNATLSVFDFSVGVHRQAIVFKRQNFIPISNGISLRIIQQPSAVSYIDKFRETCVSRDKLLDTVHFAKHNILKIKKNPGKVNSNFTLCFKIIIYHVFQYLSKEQMHASNHH